MGKEKMARPKKKLVEKNSLREKVDGLESQLGQLINLLTPLLQSQKETKSASPKKRGRPAKQKDTPPKVKPTPKAKVAPQVIKSPPIPPTKIEEEEKLPEGVARLKRKAIGGEKIVRNGKEYTVMTKQPINVGQFKNTFKDNGKLVAHEKLNYPEHTEAREPAVKEVYICDHCGGEVELYPSEATFTGADSLFKCDDCILGKNKKKRTRR